MAHRAPGSSLRRTGPRRHQAVKAKAHGENDPATTKSRLSDRSTESSTQPSTSAVIFEPGYWQDPFPLNDSLLFSRTHEKIADTLALRTVFIAIISGRFTV